MQLSELLDIIARHRSIDFSACPEDRTDEVTECLKKAEQLEDTVLRLRDVIEQIAEHNDGHIDDPVIDDLCDAAIKSDRPCCDRVVMGKREVERLKSAQAMKCSQCGGYNLGLSEGAWNCQCLDDAEREHEPG